MMTILMALSCVFICCQYYQRAVLTDFCNEQSTVITFLVKILQHLSLNLINNYYIYVEQIEQIHMHALFRDTLPFTYLLI